MSVLGEKLQFIITPLVGTRSLFEFVRNWKENAPDVGAYVVLMQTAIIS